MNKILNHAAIYQVLMDTTKEDKDTVVLCSDSRGSASPTPFVDAFPEQFAEVGIAEQNLVSISAGLVKCGKRPSAASSACFLSTRSYERIKVDVAYSNTSVKLIGTSGGVSYGAPGMSHHSCQDIAGISAIPNMRIYIPSDCHQTACLIRELTKDNKPAYIRVGRNPMEGIYEEGNVPFQMDQATALSEGMDIAVIACGGITAPAKKAAELLKNEGKAVTPLDIYRVKLIDAEVVIRAAKQCRGVITVEEHSPYGGLEAMVSQIVSANYPKKVINMSLPDAPVTTGISGEVFDYYGLNPEGTARQTLELLKD